MILIDRLDEDRLPGIFKLIEEQNVGESCYNVTCNISLVLATHASGIPIQTNVARF